MRRGVGGAGKEKERGRGTVNMLVEEKNLTQGKAPEKHLTHQLLVLVEAPSSHGTSVVVSYKGHAAICLL